MLNAAALIAELGLVEDRDGNYTPEGFLWRGRVTVRLLEWQARVAAILVKAPPELLAHPFHAEPFTEFARRFEQEGYLVRRLPDGFCLEPAQSSPCRDCGGPVLRQCLVCGARPRGGWWPF